MTLEKNDLIPGTSGLSNAELDRVLEDAVVQCARAEKLVCVYLDEVQERGAYREFGFANVYDYAAERFGFKERKTRYLLMLARKLRELPQLREALSSGKLGWTKAARVASVASKEDEVLWIESALAISVAELDRRIKDGTDRMAGTVRFWLTEDQRVVWENALEIARRVCGADISPGQALEYLAAEFIATWGTPPEEAAKGEETEEGGDNGQPPAKLEPPSPAASWEETRTFVLERDDWKCSYPGCNSRLQLDAHHIVFRGRGGGDEPWNACALCRFHHTLLHAGIVAVRGRAPFELVWTPPRLMREALERKRNRRSFWVGELEVREWPSPARSLAEGVPA